MNPGCGDFGSRSVVLGISLNVIPLRQDDMFHDTACNRENGIIGNQDYLTVFQSHAVVFNSGYLSFEIDHQFAACPCSHIAVNFVSSYPLGIRIIFCVSLNEVASVRRNDNDFSALQRDFISVYSSDRPLKVDDYLARRCTACVVSAGGVSRRTTNHGRERHQSCHADTD